MTTVIFSIQQMIEPTEQPKKTIIWISEFFMCLKRSYHALSSINDDAYHYMNVQLPFMHRILVFVVWNCIASWIAWHFTISMKTQTKPFNLIVDWVLGTVYTCINWYISIYVLMFCKICTILNDITLWSYLMKITAKIGWNLTLIERNHKLARSNFFEC